MNSTSPEETLSPGFTSTFQTLPGTIVSTRSAMFDLSRTLDDARGRAERLEPLAQLLRLFDADGFEAVHLAWLRLPQLPEGGGRHRIGTDESAHARPIIDQDDGRLAGQVDGAQRISLVDDIGGLGAVLGGFVRRFL